METLAQVALKIAKTQIGQQEKPKGSNWGHPVKDYLAVVNINFPASWCMAFVQWCLWQAAKQLNITSINLFNSAGVLNVLNHTSKEFIFHTPQPGDIFIQDHGEGLGHTGLVESISGDHINTIEGNTNDTGSREGFAVCKKSRLISSCKAFIRVS